MIITWWWTNEERKRMTEYEQMRQKELFQTTDEVKKHVEGS